MGYVTNDKNVHVRALHTKNDNLTVEILSANKNCQPIKIT